MPATQKAAKKPAVIVPRTTTTKPVVTVPRTTTTEKTTPAAPGQRDEFEAPQKAPPVALGAAPVWPNFESTNSKDASRLDGQVATRKQELGAAGLKPNDTAPFGALDALNKVDANKQQIMDMSAKYGVDPALLAGVVASETDFDRDSDDVHQDAAASVPLIGGKWVGTDGVGLCSVHDATLKEAVDYLSKNHLPGATEAAKFDQSSVKLRVSDQGSIEASAIVLAKLSHEKGATLGDGRTTGRMTPTSMAVTWGQFRTGGYTPQGFKSNNASGTEKLPARMQCGTNAYMSQPFFEYYSNKFPQPAQVCLPS